jgi:predicted DNA-binding transcriptional regulator YafY
MNRIDRLTAILIQLQTKRIVKAEEIADRFEISLRTVYRDVKALMEAGVPIGSEAGKGYFIVDGYHLPPVMFTQDEASAMMMAGKLVEKLTDQSVRTAFDNALHKIKAVLNEAQKDYLNGLQDNIEVMMPRVSLPANSGHFLTAIQKAVSTKTIIRLDYYSNNQGELTIREVEPIGLFYYSSGWHLIAWCRLRNGYRDFRSDRIKDLHETGQIFEARNISTLQEYFNSITHANREVQRVSVLFDKKEASFVTNSKHYFGFVSEEILDDRVRMHFLVGHLPSLGRWLLSYAKGIEIESPDELKHVMRNLVEELQAIYLKEDTLA